MKDRINSWVYSDWITNISILFYFLSSGLACGKSIYELRRDVARYVSTDITMTWINILILVLFFSSMSLAFLNDSVRKEK